MTEMMVYIQRRILIHYTVIRLLFEQVIVLITVIISLKNFQLLLTVLLLRIIIQSR